ncbi:Protein kinase domain-containing protein [Limnospira platensis C1]|nr:Protein kinase domain-containing protein [Arthrospira platensis C1]
MNNLGVGERDVQPTLLNKRYRLMKPLGHGGFGETFLAEDTQMPSNRLCVVKKLKPIINNPKMAQLIQKRFQREAAILEKLGDKNAQIPRLYGCLYEDNYFYLIQEFIHGKTLTQAVKIGGLFDEKKYVFS